MKLDKQTYMALERSARVKAISKVVQAFAKVSLPIVAANKKEIAAIKVKPEEEFFVGTNGIRLQAFRWKADARLGKAPLLLLHGVNGMALTWARLASLLSFDRDVTAVSLRGHGASDSPSAGCRLEETTADLRGFIASVFDRKVVLMGESWGGKVAEHLAASAPNLFEALILADAVLPKGLDAFVSAFPAVSAGALRQERETFKSRDAMEKKLADVTYLPLKDELDMRAWVGRFHETKDGRWAPNLCDEAHAEIICEAVNADIEELFRGLPLPALFIRPTFSITFSNKEIMRLQTLVPNLQIETIRGDHQFCCSNPLGAEKIVSAFLRKIGA